jgi:hypothetical protein
MRGKSFTDVMKFIAFLNIFIFSYPVFIILRYYVFNTSGGVVGAALVLFSIFFGLFATKFICRKEYYFTTRLLSYCSIIIPVLVAIGIYHGTGALRIIYESVTAGVFYIIGSLNFSKSYSEIYSTKTLSSNVVILTAVFILVNIVKALNPVRSIIFVFVILNIPIAMALISEGNIDQVFLKRGVEIPEVQRSIRKANIKLVAILYGLILVLFNIKDLLSAALKFILLTYIKLNFFIMYLISLLFANKDGSSGNQQADMNLPVDPGNGKTANNLFTFVAVILIIFILYKLIPKLFRAIVNLIRFIKSKLSKKIKINDNRYNDNECEEIIEITKQSTDSWWKRRKRLNLFSMLKKTHDPAERVRLIYRIILGELGKKGVVVAVSDTTGQVTQKAQSSDKLKIDLKSVTPIYEKVRYGEEVPNTDSIRSMEEDLLKITGKSRV